jgi:Effector protein
MITYIACGNLKIDGEEYTSGILGLHWFPSAIASGNQAHYEREVTQNLDTILATQTGVAVLNGIGGRRHSAMYIRPYHDKGDGPFNATATPTDLTAATMRDTVALDRYGNMPGPGKPRVTGTGTGSDSIVNYTPSIFTAGSGGAGQPGAPADEILLHEMVHGLRQMMGRSVKERVAGNAGMHNYEEFSAIVISNIYRSERGLPGLRQDHQGFVPLAGALTSPATFKATFSQYISYMNIEMPDMCDRLRKVTCAFNPFA